MAKKYSKPECIAIEIDGPFEPLLAASIEEEYPSCYTCNPRCKAWHFCLDRDERKDKICSDKDKMNHRF